MKSSIVLTTVLLSLALGKRKTHGFIWLDGLFGLPSQLPQILNVPDLDICDGIKVTLGLSDLVEVVCPQSQTGSVNLIPKTFLSFLGYPEYTVRNWFNMNMHSIFLNSIPSDDPTESIEDLGIPSDSIVISGYSQGGAVSLYHAIHSRFKVGGYIILCSWMPNLLSDPVSSHSTHNTNTPVLQVHGLADPVVLFPTSLQTANALSEKFMDYTLLGVPFAGHFTAVNAESIHYIKDWSRSKRLLNFIA